MARWLLGGITLLALGLRLHGIAREPLWFDEVATLMRADASSPIGVVANQLRDCQMPLQDLITWVLQKACGGRLSETMARLPAALAGAALVPASWVLAVEVGAGIAAAAFAALLVAVAPLLVIYGQEGRPYALFALLAALLLIAAARLLRSRGERGARLLAVVAPLLLLVHPYGVLLLAVVVLHLAWNVGAWKENVGRVVAALLPALAIGLLWFPIGLWQLRRPSSAFVYDELTPRSVLAALDGWTLEGAAAATGELGRCTFVQLVLAIAGATILLARRRVAEDDGGGGAADDDDARRVRRATWALAIAGTLALVVAAAWPASALESIAGRHLRSDRPLDEQGRSFVRLLRPWCAAFGVGLVALAALVRVLPRIAGRRPVSPRAVDWLLPLSIVVPFAAIVLADRAGAPTFLARHSIWTAAPLAVLAAAAIAGPERRPTRMLLLTGLLVAASARGFHPSRPVRVNPDFRRVAQILAENPALTPVTHPRWIARCVEYYAERPWRSITGIEDVDEARQLAERSDEFLLILAYERFVDPTSVRRALERSHGTLSEVRADGVRCERWRRR